MAPPDVLASQGRRQATAHAGDATTSRQRAQLRRELKQRRNSLPDTQREQIAHEVLLHLKNWRLFRNAHRIAAYDAVGAELPTAMLQAFIQQSQAELYLPTLPSNRKGRLRFVRTTATSRWRHNRYAIPEPLCAHDSPAINPAFLDLILVPLVGFDANGNRIGMGAGYYDRTLVFRGLRKVWQRPRLVGLAYACQQVEALPSAPWDIPLDAIVTENGIITPN